MTHPEITQIRLRQQQITGSTFTDAQELLQWMGAVQAQDYNMSKWAVGLRLQGAGEPDVEAALNRGDIIRTHVMRPTWHLAPASDIRWMLEISARQIKNAMASANVRLGLDQKIYSRCNRIFEKVLEGGHFYTRAELMQILEKEGIVTGNMQAAHIMMEAETDAVVCNGPRRGKEFTYALFDERVPAGVARPREEAIALLAARYFQSHAPATLPDFIWWSGLPAKEARAGLEAIKSTLISEKIDHNTYWMPQGLHPGPAHRPVFYLPAFDEYMVSYKDRSASLDPEIAKEAISSNGIFKPIIVHEGRVAGIWQRSIQKTALQVINIFFPGMEIEAPHLLEPAAAHYAAFEGKELRMV